MGESLIIVYGTLKEKISILNMLKTKQLSNIITYSNQKINILWYLMVLHLYGDTKWYCMLFILRN